jgi:DNA-binding CsgD family transcriptional regulator
MAKGTTIAYRDCMVRLEKHDHWRCMREIDGGGSLAGLEQTDPIERTLSTLDVEHLLVHQGWFWLRSRVIDCVQEISMGTSTWHPTARHRLTPREFQVVALSARGMMAKEVGSELAITAATARGTLSRSMAKLGLARGARLVSAWCAFTRPAKSFTIGLGQTELVFTCELAPRDGVQHLTPSERSILGDLLAGRSNRTISVHRGTSERTVANQVAILFRKFRVSTRRELSAKVLGRAEPSLFTHQTRSK